MIGLAAFYARVAVLAGGVPAASGAAIEYLRTTGAVAAGGSVALALIAGLLSGRRGALARFSRADVHHFLLGPVDVGEVIRAAARRKCVTLVCIGGVVGLVGGAALGVYVGVGKAAAWGACGIGFGVLIASAYSAPAALGSLRSWPAGVVSVVVAAIGATLFAESYGVAPIRAWEPVGQIALLPLGRASPASFVVAGSVLVALAYALLSRTRVEIGRFERAAGIAPLLRFAASMNDMHATTTLFWRLAGERVRSNPRVRLRMPTRFPALGRSVRGAMRWPGSRIRRVAALAALQVLVLRVTWASPLEWFGLLGAACAFVIALDLNEPFVAESADEDRSRLWPRGNVALALALMLLPAVALALLQTGVILVAHLGVVGVSVSPAVAIAAGCLSAAATTSGVGLALTSKATLELQPSDLVGPLELAFLRTLFRLFFPQIVTVIGFVIVILAPTIRGPRALVDVAVPLAITSVGLPLAVFILREGGVFARVEERVGDALGFLANRSVPGVLRR